MNEIVEVAGELAIPGVITATSLTLPEDLPYERWVSIGETLKRMEKSVQWWIGDWLLFGNRKYGELSSQAKDLGNSPQTFMNYQWVASKVETSRRRETLTFGHHDAVAGLLKEQAELLLDKAEAEDLTIRELREQVRWEKYVAKRAAPPENLPMPRKQFSVIYADPPWEYEDRSVDVAREIENQYPTMTLDAICALAVSDIAHQDCILFLWATSPKLAESMQVVTAWGFQYRTCMVWVKEQLGMGYWVRQQHELLLIAKRGDIPTPLEHSRPRSVVNAPRTKHSVKPDAFYGIIEAMYPNLPRVELFARKPRPGWDAWGSEVA